MMDQLTNQQQSQFILLQKIRQELTRNCIIKRILYEKHQKLKISQRKIDKFTMFCMMNFHGKLMLQHIFQNQNDPRRYIQSKNELQNIPEQFPLSEQHKRRLQDTPDLSSFDFLLTPEQKKLSSLPQAHWQHAILLQPLNMILCFLSACYLPTFFIDLLPTTPNNQNKSIETNSSLVKVQLTHSLTVAVISSKNFNKYHQIQKNAKQVFLQTKLFQINHITIKPPPPTISSFNIHQRKNQELSTRQSHISNSRSILADPHHQNNQLLTFQMLKNVLKTGYLLITEFSKLEQFKIRREMLTNNENSAKTYDKINLETRKRLVTEVLQQKHSIAKTASKLGIKLSTAKSIVTRYKQEGTFFQMKKEKTERLRKENSQQIVSNSEEENKNMTLTPKVHSNFSVWSPENEIPYSIQDSFPFPMFSYPPQFITFFSAPWTLEQ